MFSCSPLWGFSTVQPRAIPANAERSGRFMRQLKIHLCSILILNFHQLMPSLDRVLRGEITSFFFF